MAELWLPADERLVDLDHTRQPLGYAVRSSIISRMVWPSFHAVFWFTPIKRDITTDEMPLEDVSTRKIAAIQVRRSSFVA